MFNQCNQTPFTGPTMAAVLMICAFTISLIFVKRKLVYNLSIILLAIYGWPSTYIFYLMMIQSAFMYQNRCPVVGCRLSVVGTNTAAKYKHDYYLKDFFSFSFTRIKEIKEMNRIVGVQFDLFLHILLKNDLESLKLECRIKYR